MFAHFQVFVYLDRFRNLDLFHQGEYAIRVRVFSDKSLCAARPISFMEIEDPESPSSYPGGINDADSSFRVSSFYIRYREETHSMLEGSVLELELPTPEDFVFEDCVVQFELLFQKPIKAHTLTQESTADRLPSGLRPVAKHMFRFVPSAQGTHGHCHITFDEMHTCIVESYVSCTLTHYTAERMERIPRVYVPPPPEKKGAQKKGKDEAPPPDVGPETREPNMPDYGRGRIFPHVTYRLPPAGRHPGDERAAPVVPTTPGRAAGSAAKGRAAGGMVEAGAVKQQGPASARSDAAREGGDRCPTLQECTASYLHQCLATLAGADQELARNMRSITTKAPPDACPTLSFALGTPAERAAAAISALAPAHEIDPGSAEAGAALIEKMAGSFEALSHRLHVLWQAYLCDFAGMTSLIMRQLEDKDRELVIQMHTAATFTETVDSRVAFDSAVTLKGHTGVVRRMRQSHWFKYSRGPPLRDVSVLLDHTRTVIFKQVQAEASRPSSRRDRDEGDTDGADLRRNGISRETFGDLAQVRALLQESGVSVGRVRESEPSTEKVMVHKALLEATRTQDVSAFPPAPSFPGIGLEAVTLRSVYEHVSGEELASSLAGARSPHAAQDNNAEGGAGEGGQKKFGGRRRGDGKEGSRAAGANVGVDEQGQHLFVFVHGFQGNQYDLRMIKNALADVLPDADFLLSSSNENDTYSDIQTLGERLAREVDRHIQQMLVVCGRISFIGHSLGGVIARVCIGNKLMERYRSKFHTYCSLGSAHLGYQYSDNSILDGGMWFLKKLKNSTALHQFCMSDSKNSLTTFMYRLSEYPGLSSFTNVLFVASPQDGYAPYYSARVEMHARSLKDVKAGSVHLAMVQNILRPLQDAGTNVVRFEVHFHIQGQGLNGTIKRAAHIMLLENLPFIRHFFAVNKHYFE